jgi:DNA-binding NarL/FixJ family response regulator
LNVLSERPADRRLIEVVVCDDVPELRGLLRYELEEDGDIRVVGEAADGRGALAIVQEGPPDVLLLDLSMPDMDGLEVLFCLKSMGTRVRVVICSGYTFEVMGERALASGADFYVEKGIPGEELREVVRAAMNDSRR